MEKREIKFRAWSRFDHKMISAKKMADQPWNVYGSMYKQNGDWKFMQYTGLKDKNGKEIFEGDILKDDVGDILEVKFGKLPLDKSGDCVCTYEAFYCKSYGQLGKTYMHECQKIGNWMEIIGNIYENPELLQGLTNKE